MLARPSNSHSRSSNSWPAQVISLSNLRLVKPLGLPRCYNTVDSTDNLLQCGRFKPPSLKIRRTSGIREYQSILMSESNALSVDVGRVPDVSRPRYFYRLDPCARDANSLPIDKCR